MENNVTDHPVSATPPDEENDSASSGAISVYVNQEEQRAYVTIRKSDAHPLFADVVGALQAKDVIFWVDEQTIKRELERGIIDKPFVAAFAKDGQLEIKIDRNLMAAYITLRRAYGGVDLTLEDIEKQIEQSGVVFGVSGSTVRSIFLEKTYDLPILVASGKEPVHGVDAHIELSFPTEFRIEPKTLENDKVDYKELQMIFAVAKGDLLARKIPATSGEPGSTITGKTLPAKKGKDIPFVAGRNSLLSDDGLSITSAIDGQPILKGNAVFIEPVLTVPGDVDYNVGNISFKGSVKVLGSVLSGFSVKATENIEIDGVVEDCTIQAGRDINIKGGVLGADEAIIEAGRDITFFFVENCFIEAGRTVTVGDALNAEISAGDSINAILGRGRILGGKMSAGNLITANILGSGATEKTQIIVGFEPKTMAKLKNLQSALSKAEYTYEEITKHIRTLAKLRSENLLSEEKEILYTRLLATEEELKHNMEELKGDIGIVESTMSKSVEPHVKIRKTCHANVRIRIGRLFFDCQEEYHSAIFFEEGEEIKVNVYESFV